MSCRVGPSNEKLTARRACVHGGRLGFPRSPSNCCRSNPFVLIPSRALPSRNYALIFLARAPETFQRFFPRRGVSLPLRQCVALTSTVFPCGWLTSTTCVASNGQAARLIRIPESYRLRTDCNFRSINQEETLATRCRLLHASNAVYTRRAAKRNITSDL